MSSGKPCLPLFALVCALAALGCGRSPVGATTASSALYARTDSNATTVWSPRMRVAGSIGEAAGVEAAVALDAWTGASVDVTTAATKAIQEVRKEVTAGAHYTFSDLTISGGYRYSNEPDYWSHGGIGTFALDLANHNTTLALALFGNRDEVGRAGDPSFKKPQGALGARLSLTQVIDTQSLIQLSWETTRVNGFQASPYRYVAIGGQGTCASSAPLCLPEHAPDERLRHAAVVRGRRALGRHVSVGLEYRFYFDDWGLRSQTVAPDLAFLVVEHGTLSLGYRYYTQNEADFYKPRYLLASDANHYVTRDRELSAMYANRLSLGYKHDFELGTGGCVLSSALRTGITRYKYLAFVGLERVDALEGTVLLSLDWR
jgi:hypothetical protein